MHCASAGVQPLHVAPRNTLLSLKRTRTTPEIRPPGLSLIALFAHDVHAASVPRRERSFTLYSLAERGAPSVARHVAELHAGAGEGAACGGGDGSGAGAAVGAGSGAFVVRLV